MVADTVECRGGGKAAPKDARYGGRGGEVWKGDDSKSRYCTTVRVVDNQQHFREI